MIRWARVFVLSAMVTACGSDASLTALEVESEVLGLVPSAGALSLESALEATSAASALATPDIALAGHSGFTLQIVGGVQTETVTFNGTVSNVGSVTINSFQVSLTNRTLVNNVVTEEVGVGTLSSNPGFVLAPGAATSFSGSCPVPLCGGTNGTPPFTRDILFQAVTVTPTGETNLGNNAVADSYLTIN